jgi:hypothetical protein
MHGGRPEIEAAKKRGLDSGDPGAVATTKTAERIADAMLERPLSPDERHRGGVLVHFAYGAAAGAAYGLAVERYRPLREQHGVLFGLAVWSGSIPLALPVLGLTRAPWHYSADEHSFSIASHLVYGLITELVRRAVRESIDSLA